MIKRFSFFIALFICPFLLASSETDFNSLKSRIQQELVTMDNYLLTVDSELGDSFDQFSQLTYPSNTDYGQGYNQALQDVSRSVMGSVRNAQQTTSFIHSQITATQALVSDLQYGSNTNIDYTAILQRMTNQLETITLHSENISTNTALTSYYVSECHGILDAILTAVLSLSDSSGGGSTDESDYTELLEDIISILRACRTRLDSLDSNVSSLNAFFTQQDGIFRSYLSLVSDRIKTPDINLSTDLARMWEYTLLQMTNIVYHPESYQLSTQINPVMNNVGESDTRLSNEGVIQLQNLAINQRQYLCSVEALRALQASTNRNDVGWITNYLASVQAGYYSTFNDLFGGGRNVSPFYPPNLQSITNFLFTPSRKYANYIQLVSHHSNTLQRIEIALWALNGMFGSDNLSDSDEVNDLLNEENFERRSEYMTNALSQAIGEVGGISNNLSSVVSSFKTLVESFDLENQSSTSTEITLIPEYELGGVEISHVHLSQSDYSGIQDFARIAFTCIYYLVFAVIFFHMFLFAIKVFTKSVAFVASTVSKLLS